MCKQIRAFIALELCPEIKTELLRLQARLKPAGADVKWTRPELMHITLKFLGNVTQSRIEEIKGLLDTLSLRHRKYEISLRRLGAFPALERVRIIWVDIASGTSATVAIARDIEEGLAKLGFAREKHPFKPHLTLGRVRSPGSGKAIVSKIKGISLTQKAVCPIEKITLFQSTLTSAGPIYTRLHESGLSR